MDAFGPGASATMPPTILRAKVAVLGAEASGKTALLNVLTHGVQAFPGQYTSTTGVETLVYRVDKPSPSTGRPMQVELYCLDCSGHAVMLENTQGHLADASAAVVVIDVTAPEALEAAQLRYDRWLANKPQRAVPPPCLVLCTKCDQDDTQRTVSREAVAEWAQSRMLECQECSAAHNVRVNDAFDYLAEQYLHKYEEFLDSTMQEIRNAH